MVKKWWQVYAGDEEKRFFVGKDGKSGLVRSPDFQWRSTDSIAREAGLTKAVTEQLIDKYLKAGMVFQHPKDPEKWGYWEKVAPHLGKAQAKSVADQDKDNRVDKAAKAKK